MWPPTVSIVSPNYATYLGNAKKRLSLDLEKIQKNMAICRTNFADLKEERVVNF